MFKILKKIFPIIFIFLITCLFFYQTVQKGLIPFPGDMLVGAYYPWLDYKWEGLTTNVPIKNPLISDVFSQIYLWKNLIIESIHSNNIPLWNQFSYSGYPLLANFQSGFLNPFNLLILIFGKINGWTSMIFCQYFLSTVTMFLFLKEKYKNNLSNIIGAISYGFCGFATVWSQYTSAGFAMIWLPLIFLNIEHFFKTQKIKYLLFLSPLYFLLMTTGHFQSLIYGCLFSGFYFLWKLFHQKENFKKPILFYSISVIFGLAFMTIQLFPTLELSKNSIRFSENYISDYNYGLLSLDKIVTFFAPDYFGNPTTFNYRGGFNYFETVIYVGILAVFGLIFSIYNFKKLKDEKFFLISALLIMLLVFNTFFGKIIYIAKFPGLSTSAAGRIILIFSFCLAVLIANFIEKISIHNVKNTIRYYWGYLLFLFLITVFTFICYKNSSYSSLQKDYFVSLRNLFLPIVFSCTIAFILAFIKNLNLKRILILFVVIFDLFRFGWKFTPFTNKEYLYPKTDITTFLQNQTGLFRIEKEKGPLLTSSTWMAYNLSSTSGYDPMALYSYSYFYDEFLNKSKTPGVSRYSEIDKYDAQNLGETNVKYLLALKYQKDGDTDKIYPDGDHLNQNINLKDWKKVHEYGSVVVLENQKFKPRIEIKNQNNQGSIENINYFANKISFKANTTEENSILILRDTWYPGWHAFVNDTEVPINKYLNIYRQINIHKGESSIKFVYQPQSFIYGFYIFISTLVIWLVFIIKFRNKKI